MVKKTSSIILLRTIHATFAVYFIFCIGLLYYTVFTLHINLLFIAAMLSLAIEGFVVFILNGGDCPLIHLQKKIDDPVPFFNLFLPDYLAKKAVPFFTVITFLGVFLLIIRLWL